MATLAVTGVGILTSSGLTAPENFFSIRSGITRLRKQELPDSTRQWISGGNIFEWVPGVAAERLRQLAEKAIVQSWQMAWGYPEAPRRKSTALFIGSPEHQRPGYSFPYDGTDLKQWLASIGITSIVHAEQIGGGSCSAHLGLIKASEMFSSGEVHSCIIGAVDSLLQVKILRWLEMDYRLKCSYMNDGLIPGEGACFFVVEPLVSARTRQASILACIEGVTVSKEPVTITSDAPNTATGLTQAVGGAINAAGVSASDLDSVWCDLNGESYRAREWAFVEVRQALPSNVTLYHPADSYGDIGGSTDSGLIGMATLAQATGSTHGKRVLVFSGSEGGVRAASVIGVGEGRVKKEMLQVSDHIPQLYSVDLDIPSLGPDQESFEESSNPPRAYFSWEMRQEHLDDLISLYFQRKALQKDVEIPWYRVAEPEQRILNHLDAVMVNGATSIWAIASGLLGEEEGAVFVGALVLTSLDGTKGLDSIRQSVSAQKVLNLRGLCEALKHCPHRDISSLLREWIRSQGTDSIRIIALESLGYRREGDIQELNSLLNDESMDVRAQAANGLRRLRGRSALYGIESSLNHTASVPQEEVLLASLCLGSRIGLDRCRRLIKENVTQQRTISCLMGMSGGHTDIGLWRNCDTAAQDNAILFLSAGILGCVEVIPLLMKALSSEHEGVRIAAAQGLELITGAGIREELPGAGEIPEEESSQTVELQKPRPSTKKTEWELWWNTNGSRFASHVRWRKGEPFHFGLLIDELAGEGSTYLGRLHAYLELVIRSGHDIPFEPDWFVAKQKHAISCWQEWWRSNESRFIAGKWYFNGTII